MPPQTGDRDTVLARRAEVATRYCRGQPQRTIAAALGVSQQQISLDMRVVRAEWRRTMADEFDRLKAEQLARIDAVEVAAWEGWERSCADAERTLTRKVTDADGDRIEASRTVAGQAGDPRFLQIIDSCIDRRLRLIGGYPAGDGPPPPSELVIRVYGPGMDLASLHGGRALHGRNGETRN
jgi:hypothetical protein